MMEQGIVTQLWIYCTKKTLAWDICDIKMMENTLRPGQNGWHFADSILNAFSVIEVTVHAFQVKLHLSSQWSQWQGVIISSGNCLVLKKHQAITWVNDDPVLGCLHVYRQVSNIRRTLAVNKFVDHLDVVGASPVGAAPTTSSFST